MYDNEFFVIDMASCASTGEVINSLTLALEALNHASKKIVLKLNDSHFNQSQMLSIQSLIASYGCILDTVETTNPETAKIVENMNIYVQEPIEKRVEKKYDSDLNVGFEPFSMSKPDDKIALKDVTGLHFEADLDDLQQKQEKIDIPAQLENAGINPNGDFKSIEEQVIKKYSKEEENLEAINKFANFDIKSNDDNLSDGENIKAEELNNDQLDSYDEQKENNDIDEIVSLKAADIDTLFPKKEEETEIPPENTEKNSIGVYKKAYDEFEEPKEDWEEVDFYETPTNDPVISDTKNTVYINQTLRSGQILESDGNVVIIGDCHPGSEIRAVGDITVWGVLSGIAHAGCKGNINAKVRALKMNAVQLRIGNCYSRRPDSTNIPYIIKTSVFTPEEARAVDNEIMLFKINQN